MASSLPVLLSLVLVAQAINTLDHSAEAAEAKVRVKRQLTLTDYVHVHNPNPGSNSFDWLPGNSEIQSPHLPILPSPPPFPWLVRLLQLVRAEEAKSRTPAVAE